jgi:hypothetical protein
MWVRGIIAARGAGWLVRHWEEGASGWRGAHIFRCPCARRFREGW